MATKLYNVRLSEEWLARLHAAAAARGLSPSEFGRRSLMRSITNVEAHDRAKARRHGADARIVRRKRGAAT